MPICRFNDEVVEGFMTPTKPMEYWKSTYSELDNLKVNSVLKEWVINVCHFMDEYYDFLKLYIQSDSFQSRDIVFCVDSVILERDCLDNQIEKVFAAKMDI